ncbi:hypothetical protein AVEN_28705-1 [Araneus ventricosus]|uniref:Uncharacterized protein n=1 Tax=Araneus ventricosus TaxID=182803 RepID=A0A4Y2J2D5_ARAVE|nr:hypothetical protein AVEN_28705-1 [Araneus ventricosus]
MRPELQAHSSSNFSTTPMGGRLTLDGFFIPQDRPLKKHLEDQHSRTNAEVYHAVLLWLMLISPMLVLIRWFTDGTNASITMVIMSRNNMYYCLPTFESL